MRCKLTSYGITSYCTCGCLLRDGGFLQSLLPCHLLRMICDIGYWHLSSGPFQRSQLLPYLETVEIPASYRSWPRGSGAKVVGRVDVPCLRPRKSGAGLDVVNIIMEPSQAAYQHATGIATKIRYHALEIDMTSLPQHFT